MGKRENECLPKSHITIMLNSQLSHNQVTSHITGGLKLHGRVRKALHVTDWNAIFFKKMNIVF